MRTPGLTLRRLPVFVWSMLVTSVLNLIWVPVIGVAMVMGLLDRLVTTNFFSAQGLPLLWQDLFWLFGPPEVYIIMLRSEEHTSELQSLMRTSYAVFCLKNTTQHQKISPRQNTIRSHLITPRP